MTILKILTVLFALVVLLLLAINASDFCATFLNAKTARRLGDLNDRRREFIRRWQDYNALNAEIHSEASLGMKCAKIYVRRKYADLFERRLKRRGFQVEREDYYQSSSSVRLIVVW